MSELNIPDIDDIAAQERLRQDNRMRTLPQHAAHLIAERTVTLKQTEAYTKARQGFREAVARRIRSEARAVAAELKSSGARPDVVVATQGIHTGRSMFNRASTKLEKGGNVQGWVLTPPVSARRDNGEIKAHLPNPNAKRVGLMLGTDGVIHQFFVNEPLRQPDKKGRPMVLTGSTAHFELVREDQICEDGQTGEFVLEDETWVYEGGTFTYEDRTRHNYGNPNGDDAAAPPGYDDMSMMHGLGIREALGALQARAELAPQS